MNKKKKELEMDFFDENQDLINKIDMKIVELLDQRARIIKKIGEFKKDGIIQAYRAENDKELIDRVLLKSSKVFPVPALLQVFTEIISAARSLQAPVTAGYLGPEGSFTEQAAIKQFGSSVILKTFSTVPDVFREVENGKTDYGVVPIENSLNGTENITLDEFVDSPVKLIGEVYLNIHQNILANVSSLSEIKRIYSHPQSFGQCRMWLETNMPNVEKIEASSNSKAASMVPWDKYSAAIAGSIAAKKYNLNILAENIEDNPENYTRFWIISGRDENFEKPDKTTILVSVKDRPGALLDLLRPFDDLGINLSKIQSRPSKRRPWDYLFFIDLEAGLNNENTIKAIESVKENSVFLKILGSYYKKSY